MGPVDTYVSYNAGGRSVPPLYMVRDGCKVGLLAEACACEVLIPLIIELSFRVYLGSQELLEPE